jgi:hypothetical protein
MFHSISPEAFFFILSYFSFLFYLTIKNVQLVARKTGKENFPNVNLVLSICQLIVYFTIPIK